MAPRKLPFLSAALADVLVPSFVEYQPVAALVAAAVAAFSAASASFGAAAAAPFAAAELFFVAGLTDAVSALFCDALSAAAS